MLKTNAVLLQTLSKYRNIKEKHFKNNIEKFNNLCRRSLSVYVCALCTEQCNIVNGAEYDPIEKCIDVIKMLQTRVTIQSFFFIILFL